MPAADYVKALRRNRTKAKSNATQDGGELVSKATAKAKAKGKARPRSKATGKAKAQAKPIWKREASPSPKPAPMEEPAVAEIKCVSPRENFLLPAYTKNLLCNWAGAGDGALLAIIRALRKLWGSRARDAILQPTTFYDLGCGDGRVVHVVCKTFPSCLGKGIDLNKQLVDEAIRRSKRLGIAKRCTFMAGDIMGARLKDADVVFLYFPHGAMGEIVRRVIMTSKMQPGTSIFTAEEPLWQPIGQTYYPSPAHGVISLHEDTGPYGLYHYIWHGTQNPIDASNSGVQKSPMKSPRSKAY